MRVVYGVSYRLMGGFDLLALSDKVYIEQFDQEYVQLLACRHDSPKPPPEEENKAPLPTECQAAEGQAYRCHCGATPGDHMSDCIHAPKRMGNGWTH